ncbi:helix-turn-helix domain-containing protein [Paraburkholderia sp. RL17-337-BIB-A]|uniref:helix-turn-helix domain-containing protein n=1 Tax=Paraburkholderia sp. RL17-337-BIB-A TaxID=3031636 RepID=UPI0038B80C19
MSKKIAKSTLRLGDAVRARRLHLGLTQQALADRTGFSRGHIATIERTSGNLRLSSLDRLARVLELDVVDLVRATGESLSTVSKQDAAVRAACHIFRLRTDLKLSQERLSEAAGFFRTYVTEIELLVSVPAVANLEAIGAILKVSVADLLTPVSDAEYEARLARKSARSVVSYE